MAYRGSTARVRAPLQARSRKRWLLAAVIAGLWLVFLMGSGSLLASTTLLVLLGAVAGGVVVVLRLFGFGRDHPWFHRAASRPWRDGRDVLQVALRHLPEVFIVTPQGSLLAPNAVELRMNPADLESLAELIDHSLGGDSADAPLPTDLGHLASDVVASEQLTYQGRLQVLKPACPVLADVGRVDARRMMANLLSNATRAAGPDGQVTLRIASDHGYGVLVVEDDGPGFARIPPGTGLGRSVIAECLIRCGGRVGYGRSEAGGVKATVSLPLAGG